MIMQIPTPQGANLESRLPKEGLIQPRRAGHRKARSNLERKQNPTWEVKVGVSLVWAFLEKNFLLTHQPLKTLNWQINHENPKGLQIYLDQWILWIYYLSSNKFLTLTSHLIMSLRFGGGGSSGYGQRVKIKPHKQQPYAMYFPWCNCLSFN